VQRIEPDPTPSPEGGFASRPGPGADRAAHAPLFVGSEIFRRPAFGGNHPLTIVRHAAVVDLARILGWLDPDNFIEIEPATVDQLTGFHDRAYVRALQYADSEGRVAADVRDRYQIGTLENPLFPGVFARAAMTVGGSIMAARLALDGHVVFHPSGGTHHGRRDRACGFCYFNDPVFAISTFIDRGCDRVLYLDFDAHHGDGVEEAFFEDERVTTLSIHEDYRWPYSGHSSYPRAGAWNLPVPVGFNDSEFDYLLQRAVLPFAKSLAPDALVICCGADALAGDPLSGMELSNVVLWQAVSELVGLGLPTVVVGGGGYNPWTLTRYWTGLWGRLTGRHIPERLPAAATGLLEAMDCDLVDDEDFDARWLTTMADIPYPGPVRDSIKSLADAFGL
jgi:acetoin utilization protein AcuC